MTEKRVIKNAAWIIGCKIIQSVLSVAISVISARYLGPANYGLLSYAASLTAFFLPFMKLGMDAILVRDLVSEPEKESEILGTAITMNLISAVLCMLGIAVFSSIANAGERETVIVCTLYSLILAAQAVEMIQYWFQAKLLSKYFALAMLFATTALLLYKIHLIQNNRSLVWFAISYALKVVIVDIILLVIYRKHVDSRFCFSAGRAARMLQQGKYYIISDLMVIIFTQTDRLMLKLMIGDAFTGYYSAAVTIVGFASFIAVGLIDSARPSILESKKRDQQEYERKLTQLYSILFYYSLLFCSFMMIFSPLLVKILYGAAYAPSSGVLRIIVWYSTFSYLGSARSIWILSEGRHKVLWRANASGAIANIVLNFILIPRFGINGAAFASLLTQLYANVLNSFVLPELRPTGKLLLRSLDPRICVNMVKTIIKKQPQEQ